VTGNSSDDRRPGRFASPPCLACEVAPDYFDPLGVDPQQALDVARWRRSTRRQFKNDRLKHTAQARAEKAQALASHLDRLIFRKFAEISGQVVSGYWPIKAELDLRFWMDKMHCRGARLALPVVEVPFAPLVFRAWTPDTRMERGHWNIPVPPPTSEKLNPNLTLAPLVGWDAGGYRLGYGGGYFDRTLAAMSPRPFVIGVGLQSSKVDTIYPQPHDIGLDAIVTEAGLQWERQY
jgi:5,10-methenyltetrahydrofolate synthetase